VIRVVIRPRMGGKTHEMVKLLADPDAVMVVPNLAQCALAKRMATKLGITLQPNQIITMGQARETLLGGPWRPRYAVVDNVDFILQQLLGMPIGAISLNNAELDLKPVSDEEVLQPRVVSRKDLTPEQQERYDAQLLGRLFYPENTEEYDRVILEGTVAQAEQVVATPGHPATVSVPVVVPPWTSIRKPDHPPDLLADTDCV